VCEREREKKGEKEEKRNKIMKKAKIVVVVGWLLVA
jgi:preprotein translocase subunit Sec63